MPDPIVTDLARAERLYKSVFGGPAKPGPMLLEDLLWWVRHPELDLVSIRAKVRPQLRIHYQGSHAYRSAWRDPRVELVACKHYALAHMGAEAVEAPVVVEKAAAVIEPSHRPEPEDVDPADSDTLSRLVGLGFTPEEAAKMAPETAAQVLDLGVLAENVRDALEEGPDGLTLGGLLLSDAPPEPEPEPEPVEIPARVLRALESAGYPDLSLLDGVDASEISAKPGIGPKAVAKIQAALQAQGMSLKGV